MFRFTIRELLWLTLVVAMALAWWSRESYMASDLSQMKQEASEWRQTAEALERVLKVDDWGVRRKGSTLYVYPLNERTIGGYVFEIE